VANGAARDVIAKYEDVGARYTPSEHRDVTEANLTREVEITSVECCDGENRSVAALRTGEATKVRVTYVVHRPVTDAIIEAYLFAIVNGKYGSWCQLTTASPEARYRSRWGQTPSSSGGRVGLPAGHVLHQRGDHLHADHLRKH
jgi:hypothetical protein